MRLIYYKFDILVILLFYFVVDDYVLVAKDKHGYNVEQVFVAKKLVFTFWVNNIVFFYLKLCGFCPLVLLLFVLLVLEKKPWLQASLFPQYKQLRL